MRNNEKKVLSYSAILSRNSQTGHYTLVYNTVKLNLAYWGIEYSGSGWDRVEWVLTVPSLEAMLTAMRNAKQNNIPNFGQISIDTVRAQAALIPAVGWPGEVDKAVRALVNFYIMPNSNTFREITTVRSGYSLQQQTARNSFFGAIYALCPALTERL
jgi:hypothetical protein